MRTETVMGNLIAKTEAVVKKHGGGHVSGVRIALGPLSSMSSSKITDLYERATSGTCMEGAVLEFETIDDIYHPMAQEIVLEGVEIEVPR